MRLIIFTMIMTFLISNTPIITFGKTFNPKDGILKKAIEIKEGKAYYNEKLYTGSVFTVDSKNQITEKYNYSKGSLEGKSYSYYENGNIWVITNFKDNKRDGETIIYYETKGIDRVITYKNDIQEGKLIDYYTNGRVRIKANYKDGKLDGEYITYNPTKTVAFFKDGRMDGRYTYKEKGTNEEIVKDYRDDKEVSAKRAKEYVVESDLRPLEKNGRWAFRDEKSPYSGTVYVEDEEGNVVEQYTLRNGLKNGPYYEFYKNGQVSHATELKSERPQGEYRIYYENGILKEKGQIKRWSLDGKISKYDEKGRLVEEVTYKDGKKIK